MSKKVMILIAAVMSVLAVAVYFLLGKKKASPAALTEEQLRQQEAQRLDEELANAEKEAALASIKNEQARQNIAADSSKSVDERKNEIEMQNWLEDNQEERQREKELALKKEKFANANEDEKYAMLPNKDRTLIDQFANFAYNDMKGSNAHDLRTWKEWQKKLNSDHLYALARYKYYKVDGKMQFADRAKKQNWGYTRNPSCKGAEMRSVINDLTGKIGPASWDNVVYNG